jgi:hypothetical protein
VARFKAPKKKTQVESRSRKWLTSHKALRCWAQTLALCSWQTSVVWICSSVSFIWVLFAGGD